MDNFGQFKAKSNGTLGLNGVEKQVRKATDYSRFICKIVTEWACRAQWRRVKPGIEQLPEESRPSNYASLRNHFCEATDWLVKNALHVVVLNYCPEI